MRTFIKGKLTAFDSVSAVILDIDTTSRRKELAWLDALQPYDESLPIVLMGLQSTTGTAPSSALTSRSPAD